MIRWWTRETHFGRGSQVSTQASSVSHRFSSLIIPPYQKSLWETVSPRFFFALFHFLFSSLKIPPFQKPPWKTVSPMFFLPFSISLNCRDGKLWIYSWHLTDIIKPKQYNEVHSNWSYTHAWIVSKNFSYFLACSWHLMLSSLKIPRSLSQIFFPFSTSSFLNPLFPVFCAIQPNKSENPGES